MELLERVHVEAWSRLTHGPMWSPPWISVENAQLFEDVQAWLAGRVAEPPSLVRSAVENFARVLDDWLLCLHYELDLHEGVYSVRKWYHRGLGGTGAPREVEFFACHTLLIRNLTAEMTRAVNLVITRVRAADESALEDIGFATVDSGADHAPMHAARYSAAEQQTPQPYPGLVAFPAVVEQRDIGALGEIAHNEPRRPVDFERWIAELLKRTRGRPSGPPPPAEPSIPRRRRDPEPGLVEASSWHTWIVSGIFVAVAIVTAVTTIGQAFAEAWLLHAAIGALVFGVPLTPWLRRRHPPLWALAVVAAGAVTGMLIGHLLDRGPSPAPPRVIADEGHDGLRSLAGTRIETTGGETNTWTNYRTAGGTRGPTIDANLPIRVSCKVRGFRVASGNPWWYRIASSPWKNRYYASADAFYNNGETTGPLFGTPFVDRDVRDCRRAA